MKKIGRQEIERYYDSTKSIKDNIAILSKNGFQVSKDTLYRYCKEKGIGTKSSKETVCEDAKELVDPTLTSKENQKKLYVDYGINKSLCDRPQSVMSLEKIDNLSKEPEVIEPAVDEPKFGVLSPEDQKIVDDYIEYEKSGGWNKDYPPFQ
jgi:hypothetical protein